LSLAASGRQHSHLGDGSPLTKEGGASDFGTCLMVRLHS
jgi:hypothetical protein